MSDESPQIREAHPQHRLLAPSKLIKQGFLTEIFCTFLMSNLSVLETNYPVFHQMHTKENKDDIERFQKIVLKINMGNEYTSHEASCQKWNVESLESRCTKLSLIFALKCTNNEKFKPMFWLNTGKYLWNYKEIFSQTSRHQSSTKMF